MTRSIGGRLPLLFAALLALGLVLLLNPQSASAAPAAPAPAHLSTAPGGAAPAGALPESHRCERFGATVGGYRAAHCADLYEYENSEGYLTFKGQGQAYCIRVSDDATVPCAGITQLITVTNLSTGQSVSSGNKVCGSAGGSACPAGRFQNLTSAIYQYCGHVYRTTVRTTTVLPGRVATSRSVDFYSYAIQVVC